ncbi:methyl-accepting chemotaxis protein [Kordiimonas pumila]|uniref:Methyl-accepting chemotaxis protein n=1 Tax=Kordiimonas pumila TaxID=2161677 RepID=A0ABV7D358_9PROT|nr:methyl-accepting chemotaxis protein [Kordiimonas pumila]
MTYLEDIRAFSARWLTVALWVHVPLVWLFSALHDQEGTLATVFVTVLAAAVPTVLYYLRGADELQRLLVSVSFVVMPALLVLTFRGHPWQIDVHMYFFAVLAVLCLFCDARAILVAAGVIAVHHLLFNIFVPSWVFPDGVSYMRVVLHAIIVVFETAALFWLALKLQDGFAAAAAAEAKASAEAEKAVAEAAEAAEAKERAERALAETELARAHIDNLETEKRLADEDHSIKAAQEREQIVLEFEGGLSTVLRDIEHVAEELEQQAESLSKISTESDTAVRVAIGSTNNVSDNVNSVAASAEEMAASINEISRQVKLSAAVADEARTYTKDSEARIKELADRADKINEVLKMIGDIAEQTNLLALNATIEAARAGEAGKGFAVVASEVKSLANQSAKATEEIGKLLAGIREATTGAVAVNNKIVTVVGQISENSATIASAISEQSAATDEIARAAQMASAGTTEATRSVDNMNAVSNSISSAAENTAGAVSALSDKTLALSERAAAFIASLRKQ